MMWRARLHLACLGALLLSGCAKTSPRAWLFNNSPYLDLFWEAKWWIIFGAVVGWLIWWYLRDHWRYQGSREPLIYAAIVLIVSSSIGIYRGYVYIHTECAWSFHERGSKDRCPDYKLDPHWRIDRPTPHF